MKPLLCVELVIASLLSAGCGQAPSPGAVNTRWHTVRAGLELQDAIESGNHYPAGSVRVLVNQDQVRIAIPDESLAEAGPKTQETFALTVARTAERVLATDPDFPKVRVLSVSIVHPPKPIAGTVTSHVEEVFEFARDATARFTPQPWRR